MQSQRFVLRMTAATTADGTRKKQRYQNLIGQKYVCGGRCPSCRKKDGGIRPRPAVFHPALRPNSARYLAAFRARYHATSPFATLLPSDTGTPSISPPFCKRRARCCPWQTFLFRPLSHHLSRREVIYGNDVSAHFGKRCAETNHRRRIQPFKHGIVAAHKGRSASFAAYHAYCHDGMLLHPVKTKFVGESKSPAYCGINNKPV